MIKETFDKAKALDRFDLLLCLAWEWQNMYNGITPYTNPAFRYDL